MLCGVQDDHLLCMDIEQQVHTMAKLLRQHYAGQHSPADVPDSRTVYHYLLWNLDTALTLEKENPAHITAKSMRK
jgi:hypothetical protein